MEFSGSITISCIVLVVIVQVLGCEDRNCVASNGSDCNDQGTCECGICACNDSYSGPTCEECPTCPAPCDIYKDCVGCKIFGTGNLGTMECIIQCDYIANFLPVDKNVFDGPDNDDGRILCKTLNDAYCMESFRIGGMSNGYRDLFVRTEEDCSAKYIPTHPPVIEVPLEPENGGKGGSQGGRQDKPEDVGAVSGTNQSQNSGDNGADMQTVSNYLIIVTTVLSLLL